MGMPKDIGIIDCMLGIPEAEDRGEWFASFRPLIKDKQTLEQFSMPAQYMFKDIPASGKQDDYTAWVVEQMDANGIERALVGWNDNETSRRAKERFGDRFFFDLPIDPNGGLTKSGAFAGSMPKSGFRRSAAFRRERCRRWRSITNTCSPSTLACELDIPFCVNAGVPGPRIPMDTQKVERIDEVCWYFPDLKLVMRHGAEPWEELAVKLMLKYPNLYYSTSAFAPKHYPKAIIDYANTRGAEKIIYAGYFPMGLSLDRIMRDMPGVPFKDEVWPKFLRENAIRVFGLEG